MKNILIYTERWMSGGIESLLINLVNNLDKKDLKINFLVSQKESEIYDDTLKDNDINMYTTLEKKYRNPIYRTFLNLLIFSRNLKKYKTDVMHINIYNSVGMVYAFLAKRKKIKKVIVHCHNNGIDNDKFKIKFMAHSICKFLFSNYADEYLACSNEAAEFCYKKKNAQNATIIKNGIDISKYVYNSEVREEYRKKLKVENNLVIGNIGRFVEQKNHVFLIEIFNEILKINNKAKLIIVGEGILENTLKNKVEELKIENNVMFLGARSDVQKILQAMDIFVFPSVYEGLGIVAIEAQAAGLKCYASTGVPKEVEITKNIKRISLEKTSKEWANIIIEESINFERENMLNKIKESGYSIEDSANAIRNIYLK